MSTKTKAKRAPSKRRAAKTAPKQEVLPETVKPSSAKLTRVLLKWISTNGTQSYMIARPSKKLIQRKQLNEDKMATVQSPVPRYSIQIIYHDIRIDIILIIIQYLSIRRLLLLYGKYCTTSSWYITWSLFIFVIFIGLLYFVIIYTPFSGSTALTIIMEYYK